MKPYQFGCRAVIDYTENIKKQKNLDCPSKLLDGIVGTDGTTRRIIRFTGEIKSPANNCQIMSNFDQCWIKAMNKDGWKSATIDDNMMRDTPDIKPDAVLSKDGVKIVIEIEKTNKKTIWFDLIKIMMHIGGSVVDFGVLVVPQNYAHKNDPPWDLFDEAVKYKSYLLQYAKVDNSLLSKIAIIGYTQEANIDKDWKQFDSSIVTSIKLRARDYFNKQSSLDAVYHFEM